MRAFDGAPLSEPAPPPSVALTAANVRQESHELFVAELGGERRGAWFTTTDALSTSTAARWVWEHRHTTPNSHSTSGEGAAAVIVPSTSTRKLRNIMLAKRLICILPSEFPLDGSLESVARVLPCIDLVAQELPAVDAPVQALSAEYADLDLRHVQPTGVLGRVVEFDAAQQLCGGALSKHVVEARS